MPKPKTLSAQLVDMVHRLGGEEVGRSSARGNHRIFEVVWPKGGTIFYLLGRSAGWRKNRKPQKTGSVGVDPHEWLAKCETYLANKAAEEKAQEAPAPAPPPTTVTHGAYRGGYPRRDPAREACAAACRGNKWAEENCRAVGNWPR